MTAPVRLNEDLYGLTELRDALPHVVEKARQTQRPMIITKHNKAVAAIVDIDELQRLYDLVEALEDRAVVLAFQAAEARGEVEWLTTEEIERFDQELIAEVNERVARRRGSEVATPAE